MKTLNLLFVLFLFSISTTSQTLQDSLTFNPQSQLNAAQKLLSGNYGKAVTVGAYGEILYNQPEGDNGTLDVQRLVLLFGYSFSNQVQFITEIEFEHVEEVYIEQAFVNYNIANNLNIRAGLMLVPMGIINEFHEPTTFNGTNRPAVDNAIVPSTWREIGLGISGRMPDLNLGYQAYLFNGFKSTGIDGNEVAGFLGGASGLRGGRQKGIRSTINTPTFSSKIEYFGISGLRLGLSGYFGKTQPEDAIEDLDGSSVGIAMLGLDARYAYQKFTARGQYIEAALNDTQSYNQLTGRDLGNRLRGWYLETAYNVLPIQANQKLFAFARYEQYDTHAGVTSTLEKNDAYNRTDITFGLSYHIAPGVVVKGDYQLRDNALAGDQVPDQLNFGVGVWF